MILCIDDLAQVARRKAMKEVMFGCAEADITPTYPVRTLGFSREDE